MAPGLSNCGPGSSCPEGSGILVPWPGTEPASPALQGGFLTTGPPGKPSQFWLSAVN